MKITKGSPNWFAKFQHDSKLVYLYDRDHGLENVHRFEEIALFSTACVSGAGMARLLRACEDFGITADLAGRAGAIRIALYRPEDAVQFGEFLAFEAQTN